MLYICICICTKLVRCHFFRFFHEFMEHHKETTTKSRASCDTYLLCSHEGVLGAVTQDFSPFIGIGANVAEYRGLEVRTMLDHAVVMSFLPKQESTLRTSDFEKAGWPLSHLSSGAGILMHSFCCLLPFGNQVRTNIEFK